MLASSDIGGPNILWNLIIKTSPVTDIGYFLKIPSFNTVKLLRYVNGSDHMVMGFEIVFFLFVVYYLVEEILEIKKVL